MSSEPAPPTFRPSKRRKVANLRHRSPDLESNDQNETAESPPSEGPVVVQKARKPRARTGLEVSQPGATALANAPFGANDHELQAPKHLGKQFAPQTGLVEHQLDKHMAAYVDTRIAQMRHPEASPEAPTSPTDPALQHAETSLEAAATAATSTHRPRQPAGAGRLQEIDLGSGATQRNIERTKAAVFGTGGDSEEDAGLRGKKGWWAERARKRRNRKTSDEIRRDEMVERILNETKPDLYDTFSAATVASAQKGTGQDVAADERMAAEFRQEYMDSQQSSNVKQVMPRKKNEEDQKPKGPKLGGSRNVRAAMQASMNKK